MSDKVSVINKAIELGDCLLMNGETVVPISLENNILLCYYDQQFTKCMQNISNVDIVECE